VGVPYGESIDENFAKPASAQHHAANGEHDSVDVLAASAATAVKK
jgi:hypothetical protein